MTHVPDINSLPALSLVLKDRRDEIDIALITDADEPVFSLYYRFVAGESFRHAALFECDNDVAVEVTQHPGAVVPPAGSFEGCLRLEFQRECFDAGIVTEWWAPGVGEVKWIEANIAGQRTFELREYGVLGEPTDDRFFRRGDGGPAGGGNARARLVWLAVPPGRGYRTVPQIFSISANIPGSCSFSSARTNG